MYRIAEQTALLDMQGCINTYSYQLKVQASLKNAYEGGLTLVLDE